MEISKVGTGFKIKGKQAVVIIEPAGKIVVGEFAIVGPGEYEIAGVTVTGIKIPTTVYRLSVDGVNICYFEETIEKLTQEQVEKLDGIDIILGKKITPQLVTEIEPVMMVTTEKKEGIIPVAKLNIIREKLPTELQTIVLE